MPKTSERFRILVYNIINLSQLKIEGGKLQAIFRHYLRNAAPEALELFQQYVNNHFKDWLGKGGSIEGISGFISQNGRDLFQYWLSEIFPFEKESLIIDCPEGHSAVDSQLIISYVYEKAELDYIKFVLDKLEFHGWKEKINDVARILFVDAIKSISDYFENLVGTKYKIYTENINLYEINVNGSIFVEFQGAGRPR